VIKMKLLKTISNYATVDFAVSAPAETAEVGDRIAMDMQEGRGLGVCLGITVTGAISGVVSDGTKINIYPHSSMTATDALTNGDANTGMEVDVPEIASAIEAAAIRVDAGTQFIWAWWGATNYGSNEILSPYVAFKWDHDMDKGALTISAYIFGDPNCFDEMPHGTVA